MLPRFIGARPRTPHARGARGRPLRRGRARSGGAGGRRAQLRCGRDRVGCQLLLGVDDDRRRRPELPERQGEPLQPELSQGLRHDHRREAGRSRAVHRLPGRSASDGGADHRRCRAIVRHQPEGLARSSGEGAEPGHDGQPECGALPGRDRAGLPGHRRVRLGLLRSFQPGVRRRPPVQDLSEVRRQLLVQGRDDQQHPVLAEPVVRAEVGVHRQPGDRGALHLHPVHAQRRGAEGAVGEGDGCSAYGNRNFYMFWSTWFGDPTASLPEAEIQAVRDANPALGASASGVECNDARTGCQQRFAAGGVFWTSTNGAKKVDGGIWGLYQQSGQQNGYLGYPTDTATWSTVNQGGWIQNFQLGAVYWSSVAGGRIVSSSIFAEYQRWGGPSGDLGWPMTDQACGLPRGGCHQVFQNGEIFWSATGGTWAVRGGVKQSFDALGGVGGTIGYPTGPEQYRTVNGIGWVQGFEGGAIYWRNGWGIHMFGGIRDAYAAAGYSDGRLGWPVSVQTCGASGCRQDFQNGRSCGPRPAARTSSTARSTPSTPRRGSRPGGWAIRPRTRCLGRVTATASSRASPVARSTSRPGRHRRPDVRRHPRRVRAPELQLGFPRMADRRADLRSRPRRMRPALRRRSIYWTSALGAVRVDKAVAVPYAARGAEKSVLGYPTGPTQARDGNGVGVAQGFEKGALYVKDGKDVLLSGPIRDEYARQGYNAGTLGWPRADAVCKLTGGAASSSSTPGGSCGRRRPPRCVSTVVSWIPGRRRAPKAVSWVTRPRRRILARAGAGARTSNAAPSPGRGARGGFVEGAASSGARSEAPAATPARRRPPHRARGPSRVRLPPRLPRRRADDPAASVATRRGGADHRARRYRTRRVRHGASTPSTSRTLLRGRGATGPTDPAKYSSVETAVTRAGS